MTFWILKNIPGAIRLYNLIAKFIVSMSTDTPQDIKEIYSRTKDKVCASIEAKFPKELVEDKNSKYDQKVRDQYKYYAEKFEFEAKRKWGRDSLKYAYESAWAYSLAAFFYEKAACHKAASDNYHYAGNAFRDLEAINQAIQHYQKSADLAEERDAWKSRNQNRVRALKAQIGENDA